MITPMQHGVAKTSYLHALGKYRSGELSEYASDPAIRATIRDSDEFYESIPPLIAGLEAIRTDGNLSFIGREAKVEKLKKAWEAEATEIHNRVTERANTVMQKLENPTLPPPVEDEHLLEARLSNARTDARMYLDPVEAHRLPHRMRELVEHAADPNISYLLVGTNWGDHYIRSRSRSNDPTGMPVTHSALLEWEGARKELFRNLLPEAAQRAWDRNVALSRILPQAVAAIGLSIRHHVHGSI